MLLTNTSWWWSGDSRGRRADSRKTRWSSSSSRSFMINSPKVNVVCCWLFILVLEAGAKKSIHYKTRISESGEKLLNRNFKGSIRRRSLVKPDVDRHHDQSMMMFDPLMILHEMTNWINLIKQTRRRCLYNDWLVEGNEFELIQWLEQQVLTEFTALIIHPEEWIISQELSSLTQLLSSASVVFWLQSDDLQMIPIIILNQSGKSSISSSSWVRSLGDHDHHDAAVMQLAWLIIIVMAF